jgi:hypothetical protein
MSVQKRKRDVDDVGSPGSGAREDGDVRLSIEKGEEHTRMRVVIPRPATVTDEDGAERQAVVSGARSSTQRTRTSLSASSTPVAKSENTSYQSSPTSDDGDALEMEGDYAKRNLIKEAEALMAQMEDSAQQ